MRRLLHGSKGRALLSARPLLLGVSTLLVAALVFMGLPARSTQVQLVLSGGSAHERLEEAARALVSKWVERRAASSLGEPSGAPGELIQRFHVVVLRGSDDLILQVEAAKASRAAAVASAVADAFLAEERERVEGERLRRQRALDEEIATLQRHVESAKRRLLGTFGEEAAEPEAARARAAKAVRSAEEWRDAVKLVIRSGTPPVAERATVPPAVQQLQADYLDKVRALATARETLGERHTTVIGLRTGVAQAAEVLTQEWQRLLRDADLDVQAAREREAAIGQSHSQPSASRRSALDASRLELADAEQALAAKQAQRAGPGIENPLFERGPETVRPVGTSLPVRILAALATIAVAVVGAMLANGRLGRRAEPFPAEEIVPAAASRQETAIVADGHYPEWDFPAPIELDSVGMLPASFAEQTFLHDEAIRDAGGADEDAAPDLPNEDEDMERHFDKEEADHALSESLRDLAASFQELEPRVASVPTVLVAANEPGLETSARTLDLGIAAAELGARVLMIEAGPLRSEALEALACEGDPLLVEAFGAVRIAMAAQDHEGLFCAPYLKDGTRIAAALARNAQATLVDEMADEFDLVLIDGGRAGESARDGWAADAYLRVARFASYRDDDRFLSVFEVDDEDFLGTIAGMTFVSKRKRRPAWRNAHAPAPRPHASMAGAARPTDAPPVRGPSLRALDGGRAPHRAAERDEAEHRDHDERIVPARAAGAPLPLQHRRRVAGR